MRPTERFTGRAEDYARYRPGYPSEFLEILRRRCGLRPGWRVADVGSGTGILTRMFLEAGCTVCGVEPNPEMRRVALRAGLPSREGSAEDLPLPEGSVDLVAAAQALHWFDLEAAAREFRRVLRPGGWVVAVWNARRPAGTPFLEAYEALLLRFGTDYREVTHRKVDLERFGRLLGAAESFRETCENAQVLDREGLRGRLLSSSYTPPPGHPHYEPMLACLEEVFEAHQVGGTVSIEYDTVVYGYRLG